MHVRTVAEKRRRHNHDRFGVAQRIGDSGGDAANYAVRRMTGGGARRNQIVAPDISDSVVVDLEAFLAGGEFRRVGAVLGYRWFGAYTP